jgi:hypothetical protein
MTRLRWILFTAGLMALVPLTAFLTLFLSTRPTFRVLRTWASPPEIRYDDWGPRHLSVGEGGKDFDGFPLHVGRRYFIYVGMEAGTPTYGHRIDHSFTHSVEDLEPYLERAKTTWSEEGVTFVEPSGHTLFIPKEWFLGGR